MNDETKKQINEKYERALQKGERFWPDSIYKDVLMALAIFLVLVLLATFVGVPVEPKADPSDSSYVPRPEWYFLFLFKFLALYGQIPLLGKIEWIATVIIPGLAIGVLTLLPFLDRGPNRYYGKRVFPISVMAIMVVSMVTLTLMSDVPTTSDQSPYIAGILQVLSGLVVPGLAMIALALLTFVFKGTKTGVMLWITGLSILLIAGMTAGTLAFAPQRTAEETAVANTLTEQIVAGQDLYSVSCVECHGDDGKVTTIEGVKGLEGKQISAIHSPDVLYTLNDASLEEVIAHGRPDAGMPPFGKAYGAELSKSEIDYIVIFMRYSWDDRFQAPPIPELYPPLADGEVPSYNVHIAPIVKRYCISCHRAGKDNNNYLMDNYANILNSGDEGPVVKAGDMQSLLLQVLEQQPLLDPTTGEQIVGVMPPKKALNVKDLDVFVRWVLAGMPETADEAAKLTLPSTPTPTPTP
jgi:mono/diheme cytochrome c family protein